MTVDLMPLVQAAVTLAAALDRVAPSIAKPA